MNAGPSPHLTWAEVACKDARRTEYPLIWRTTRAVALAEVFEAIRAEMGGKPIRIGSGYRTPAHNASVGGAPRSQHIEGRALDLYPPTGVTPGELHAAALRIAKRPGSALKGLGRYATFVHVDIRPSDVLVRWTPGVQDTGEE